MVSDAIRGEDGRFKTSAFSPDWNAGKFAANFDDTMTDSYADYNATLPIPVSLEQAVFQSTQNFSIIQFTLVNPTPERVEQMAFGLFLDFDLERTTDRIGFDTLMGLMYQYNDAMGVYVGLAGVSANEFGFRAILNTGEEKQGYSTADKYDFVNQAGIAIADTGAGDWQMVISRTATQIDGFGNRKMAVVVAAASSLPELRTAILAGMDEYNLFLDTDDVIPAVPTMVELQQNYPNPFNPETTIKFTLGSAQQASLAVYNVTGQRVRTLFDGAVQAGEHSVIWDGCDDSGRSVASGIYFYQLTTDRETHSRKMVFLK
jgi:hypothetical protein